MKVDDAFWDFAIPLDTLEIHLKQFGVKPNRTGRLTHEDWDLNPQQMRHDVGSDANISADELGLWSDIVILHPTWYDGPQ